jgi:hypothetical protein
MVRRFIFALSFSISCTLAQANGDDGRWRAGAYSYSDELGGFSIVSISGDGSEETPVTIVKELQSARPVTMIIRTHEVIRPRVFDEGAVANGFIHMRIVAFNNSGLPWVEFELELQSHRGEPSSLGDGLSFDQRRTNSTFIDADRYRAFSRDYEPYDRIRFHEGATDPLDSVTLRFFITDFTPVSQFYLVLDPRVPVT